MIYYIVRRATNEVITEVYGDLPIAKKHARAMGHTDEISGKWYVSVVFVAEKTPAGEFTVVYEPRFKVT